MPVESRLDGTPGEWTFDRDVAEHFDDMLERSIPQYDVMRATVFSVGSSYVTPGSEVVDLGCSNGLALQPFVDRFGATARYLGCDISAPMLDLARERFASWPNVRIAHRDIAHDGFRSLTLSPSLILLNLTLMFTPINYRQHILQDAYDALQRNGALILVEKVLGQTAQTDALLVREYHAMKARNGYSQDEIDRKALALEGVQVPVPASWNEDMLRIAGFRSVECFWRWMNFAAWIAIKD